MYDKSLIVSSQILNMMPVLFDMDKDLFCSTKLLRFISSFSRFTN